MLFLGAVFLLGVVITGTSGRSYEQIMAGDVTLMYTSDNYTYQNFYLQMLQRNYIVFKVKACSDAHVALMHTNGTNAKLMEIVLGGWSNTLSVIRYGAQGEWLTDTYTYDLLHCGEFRTFWVHWSSHITVGRGCKYFEQEFMSTPREEDKYFDVNYVAFSTGFGHTGVWEVTRGMAYHMMLYTPNVTPEEFQYHTRSVEQNYGFFTFRAVACHDLHIAMGPENHDWKYRVNLCAWNNTVQCIWYGGAPHCENATDVCDCKTYRPYWISWKNNVIRVGQGNRIHNSQLVEFTPPVWHTVSFLSFSTGWGSSGLWVFDEDLENSWFLKGSNRITQFENWIGTSKHHYVPFKVQACKDAWICLSDHGGVCNEYSYTLYIGKDNSVSGLSKGMNGEVLKEVSTPDILQCDMSLPFWLSWYDGKIEFGVGNDWGVYRVLDYQIPSEDSFILQAVGFGTELPNTRTLWNIKKNHGDMIIAITPPSDSLSQYFWMTTRQDVVVYFNVLGEQNAIVYLSEVPGYPDEYGYEVVIGQDNTKCIIREKRGGAYQIKAEKDTGEVMSSSEYRSFWVSWKDGYITLGAGFKYGQRVLLSLVEFVPHVITGIGVGSETERLDWEFEAEQGDYFTMRTDIHPTENNWGYKWVHVYQRDNGYWLYFQVSGVAACMALSLHYGDAKGAYVIHFGEEQNTKISMYNGDGKMVVSKVEPNMMHQDELRTFWLSWEDGLIQLGKNRYKGKNVLLSYKDGGFVGIRGLGLGGLDGYVANWRFSTGQGVEEFSYQTNTQEDNQQLWMSLLRKTDMVIGIQACKEAHLWFGGIMYSENWFDSYLIVLQDANGDSYISAPFLNGQGWSRKIEVRINRPDLLSCDEERFFWVTWLERELIIGTGTQNGKNILMAFHDFDPVPVRAHSVHSYTATAIYRYPMRSSQFADRTSPEDNSLSAGEIVAVVFGFIILTGLFVGAIFLIIRPPDNLKPYLQAPPAPSSGGGGGSNRERAEQQMREHRSPQNFENPLSQGTAEGGY